jgi:hypothetical protein
MSGKLLEASRKLIQKINSSDFSEDIILTAPNNLSISFKGLHSLHSLGYDTDGNRVETKSGHIQISEQVLIDFGYPYLNPRTKEVDLRNHKVSVKNFSEVKNYVINSFFPSQTFGTIICILGNYKV